jgi:hypothetical protein
MRYLRLIPLLVLAFGAPASADDHRVNFNGMLSLASGSSLFGAHGSVALRVGPPKFTVVLSDNSYHRGSHDEDTMTRVANMWGARWTQPVVRHQHKIVPQLLLGFVDTKIAGDSKREFAFAPGVAYEYVSAAQTARIKDAVGFSVVVDYVVTTGAETGFFRMSAGVTYRIK